MQNVDRESKNPQQPSQQSTIPLALPSQPPTTGPSKYNPWRLDAALRETRTAFHLNPAAAISEFLRTPPPQTRADRAIIAAAIKLMWCNKSTVEIEHQLQLPQSALLQTIYRGALRSIKIRNAIAKDVSAAGSQEISAILKELPVPSFAPFHSAWSARLKDKDKEKAIHHCEQMLHHLIVGKTWQEAAQYLSLSRAEGSMFFNIVQESASAILSERTKLLDIEIQKRWIKHWLPNETWGIFLARAKERLTLREVGSRFDISGERVRVNIKEITGLFPPLKALVHIPEASPLRAQHLASEKEERERLIAERRDTAMQIMDQFAGIPEPIKSKIIERATCATEETANISRRCHAFNDAIETLTQHPEANRLKRYHHVIAETIVTKQSPLENPVLWTKTLAALALRLEDRSDPVVANMVLRRLLSSSFTSTESLLLRAQELLQQITLNRQAVSDALSGQLRSEECLRSIQRQLSFSNAAPHEVREEALVLFKQYLALYEDMINHGLSPFVARLRASSGIKRALSWQETLAKDISSVDEAPLAALRAMGVDENTFLGLLRAARRGDDWSALDKLTEAFTRIAMDSSVEQNAAKQTSDYLERDLRSLVSGAISNLHERLFDKEPFQQFTGYILLVAQQRGPILKALMRRLR